MKIIQISDLHITHDSDMNNYINKIDKLYDAVHDQIKKDELVLLCVCGDVTDKGDNRGYSVATEIFKYLSSKFQSYKHFYEFVPGNHDLNSGEYTQYDKFIKQFLSDDKYSYKSNNVILRCYEDIGLDLVLVNSTFERRSDYGSVEISKLGEILKQCKKNIIIITHHTLMSRYDNDTSSIRNSYNFVDLLSEYNVCALIHGHTHGYSNITVGDRCKVIGVGPLFKQVSDVNNQFNFIDIVVNDINRITNYIFRADLNRFCPTDLYNRKNISYYEGRTLKELYPMVVENTKAYTCITNLNMHIFTTPKDFFKDIEEMFPDRVAVAKQWQQSEVPETLHYNHGEFIDKGEKKGLDYVIDELNRKATSSRAIISLINAVDIVGSGDSFLPSLDIVQFGFNEEEKTELYVTVYLRALEVNHFLRINLCEVYLMVSQIVKRIISISKLNINIISFRAQYKENFGCFQKAKIDKIDCLDLMMYVSEHKVNEIIDLLNNKLSLSETVIIDSGVINLCNCINKYNSHKKDNFYNADVNESIDILIKKYQELKELRLKTSKYKAIEEKEAEVTEQMKAVIEHLKKLTIN